MIDVGDFWLPPKRAAEYLGISVRCLEQWRERGSGPAFSKPTRRLILYRRSDLDGFLAGSRREPKQETTAA